MGSYEIAKVIRIRYHFVCQMCGVCTNGYLFQYKSLCLVPRYKPPLLEICEDCLYK